MNPLNCCRCLPWAEVDYRLEISASQLAVQRVKTPQIAQNVGVCIVTN